jgi:hypothetical protein
MATGWDVADGSAGSTVHSATLKFDEALVKRAVGCFWRRSLGLGVLIGVPILCFLLVLELMDGKSSWFRGLLAGASVVAIGMPIFVYWVHYRNSMAKFRAMREPVATLVAEEQAFTIASDKGSATLRWDSIKEVWAFEGFWLLLFSKAQFSTIPLEGLSEDMRAFILKKVRDSGGQVPI